MVFSMLTKNTLNNHWIELTPINQNMCTENPYFRSVKGYAANKKQIGNVCRTCYRGIFNNNFMKLNDQKNTAISQKLRKMLSEISPFINLNIYENPIICNKCVKNLSICYEFRMMCQKTEEQFNKWVQQRQGVSKSDVNLLILVEADDDESNVDLSTDNDFFINTFSEEMKRKKKKFSYKLKMSEKEVAKMIIKPPTRVLKTVSLCEKCGQALGRSVEGASNKCVYCNFPFNSTPTREKYRNKRQHATLDCRDCGKCFKNPKNAQLHEKNSHVELHTFLCHLCGKSFRYSYSLQLHSLQHSDGKQEKMTCGKCKKKFVNKENYIGHINSCYKTINQFKCNICYVSYWKKENFVKHKNEVHVRGNRRKCYICEVSFATQGEYVKHLTSFHMSKDGVKRQSQI